MSINLSSPPAFGFETLGCYAHDVRVRSYQAQGVNNPESSARIAYMAANFFKLLGVICPVVGIGRMIEALVSGDANSGMHFLRGVGELLGLGIFFFGIDIIVTIDRNCRNRSSSVHVLG